MNGKIFKRRGGRRPTLAPWFLTAKSAKSAKDDEGESDRSETFAHLAPFAVK
jgi:hypothetical protein